MNRVRSLATAGSVLLAVCAVGCGSGSGAHGPAAGSGADAGADSAAGPVASLENDTGVSWVLTTEGTLAPTTHLFPLSPPPPTATGGTTPEQAAQSFLAKYSALLGIANPATELSLLPSHRADPLGNHWVSLQQMVQNVPVAGRTVQVAFDKQGSILLVWSGYVSGLQNVPVQTTFSAAQAQAAAAAAMATASGGDAAQVATSTPMLAVFVLPTGASLAWHVYASLPANTIAIYPQVYVIDAHSGTVLDSQDSINTVQPFAGAGTRMEATAQGSYFDSKTLSVLQSTAAPPLNYLQQVAPGGNASSWVWVTFGRTKFDVTTSPEESSTTPNATNMSWTPNPAVSRGSDIDAYAYLVESAAWWYDNFAWSSWDGAGAPMEVGMMAGPTTNNPIEAQNLLVDNAAWISPQGAVTNGTFVVGFPSSSGLSPAAAVDVVGHEYGHAVNSGSLCVGASTCWAGSIEVTPGSPDTLPRSMNESLADVFGQFLELDQPPTTYASTPELVGEGANDGVYRNLKDPHQTSYTACRQPNGLYAQPDNVKDPFFTNPPPFSNPNSKYFGMPCADGHYFNGVPNNAWYLATFGGTNSTSNVTVPESDALGVAASESIYGALMLGPQMGPIGDFYDVARPLTILSKITGQPSDVQAVACAWYAVGVFTPDEIFFNDKVGDCQCPADTPDGTLCGGHGIWGSTTNSLYTCAGGKLTNIEPCKQHPNSTGRCVVGANPGSDMCEDAGMSDAGAPSDCFVSGATIASTLQLSGLTGPMISETDLAPDAIYRQCYYQQGGSNAVTIGYDYLNTLNVGGGAKVYAMLADGYASIGAGVTPVAGLGQQSIAAYTQGSPNPAQIDVLVDAATLVYLVAPGATLDNQVKLLQLILQQL